MSQVEQITREYKLKALQYHPDKNPDPASAETFQRLQAAKDVLTNEKTRKSYDTWLQSGIHIPFEQWQNKKGHSMHWAPPRQMKLGIQAPNASHTTDGNASSSSHHSNMTGTKNNNNNNETTTKIDGNLKEGTVLEKFRKYEI